MTSPVYDIVKVLDHGQIQLEATCANDLDIVNAARVSLGKQHDKMEEGDDKLIGFLMKNAHGTPFEHNFFKFRVRAPIFVFREWHRHRVGHSYNEMSARYTEMPMLWYIPKPEFVVKQTGKPGAYTFSPADTNTALIFTADLEDQCKASWDNYLMAIRRGVAKQQARMFLHVNHYSEMIWSCNARSLMHFLGLRNSPQAQWEIQQYAIAVEDMFRRVMPITHGAFVEHDRRAP